MMFKRIFSITALLALLSLGSGCAMLDYFMLPEPELSAEEYFEYGNDAMADKNYAASVRYFTKLKEMYPFSPYVTEAELSLGDAYFLDGDWLMATEAYKEFEQMHPRHQAIPYVLYQIGVAGLRSYDSIDRPPTLVNEAMSYFVRLRDSFPGDEYAEKAVVEIQNCRRLLAEYEIYMGDFYFRIEKYRSAWMRYQNVLRDYSDIKDLYEYANVQSQAAYALQVQTEAGEDLKTREGGWHEWFDWL
ncbi:MAG: outer membrane protein assembly factor BamD [Deltaproteobacteria bacterium]|jgi:outer membrane protein assembly factor BamD|nr:outer membrane protein assembly factor BamD [Deltaproteobacteria bacterium]